HGSNSSRLPPGVRTINVECPSHVMESFCIYEFTNLRTYEVICPAGRLKKLHVFTGNDVARISSEPGLHSNCRRKISGTLDAPTRAMNPRAEALKKRTFKFGLQVVYFCGQLRKTWEGDEFADQLFRSGTRVGANYRSACRGRSHDDFVAKLGHAVEEADECGYWLAMIAAAK